MYHAHEIAEHTLSAAYSQARDIGIAIFMFSCHPQGLLQVSTIAPSTGLNSFRSEKIRYQLIHSTHGNIAMCH